MGWIIIWLLLAGVPAILVARSDKDWISGMVVVIMVTFVLSVLSVVPTNIGAGYRYTTFEETTNIYSLRGEQELSGSFILGSGGFDTNEKYYYYQDHGGEAVIRGSVAAQTTPIIEDDSRDPQLVQRVNRITGFNYWWLHPFMYFQKDELMGTTNGSRGGVQSNTLIVPEGTIIQEFRLE